MKPKGKRARSLSNPEPYEKDSAASSLFLDSTRRHSLPEDEIMPGFPSDFSFRRRKAKRSFELTKLKAQNAWIKAQMGQLDTVDEQHSENERSSLPKVPANHSPRTSKLSPRNRRQTVPEAEL